MSGELVETVGGDQPSESMERVVGALELWLRVVDGAAVVGLLDRLSSWNLKPISR